MQYQNQNTLKSSKAHIYLGNFWLRRARWSGTTLCSWYYCAIMAILPVLWPVKGFWHVLCNQYARALVNNKGLVIIKVGVGGWRRKCSWCKTIPDPNLIAFVFFQVPPQFDRLKIRTPLQAWYQNTTNESFLLLLRKTPTPQTLLLTFQAPPPMF